jgi:flagellar biosynthesis protein FliQ
MAGPVKRRSPTDTAKEIDMVWAMLAAFLTRRSPLVQSLVVGLCCGLFVAAAADANDRSPRIAPTVVLVIVVGLVIGGLFFAGLRAQHVAVRSGSEPPRWVTIVYVVIWLLSLGSAIRALFGEGGFKVAVLAIVPIVLLGPTAIAGMRSLLGVGKEARNS